MATGTNKEIQELRDELKALKDELSKMGGTVANLARVAPREGKEHLSALARHSQERTRQAHEMLEEKIEHHPMSSVAVALGAGFILGKLLDRAEARFGRVQWKQFNGSKLIDLNFKPRLRLPLTNAPIELYATTPIGLTIPRIRDVDSAPDGSTGWNVGAGAGLNLFLTDDFGLNAEPMWIMHDFGDYRLKQFSLFLNAVLAL